MPADIAYSSSGESTNQNPSYLINLRCSETGRPRSRCHSTHYEGGDRRGRQSAAVRVWRRDPSTELGVVDTVADIRVDDAELPVHQLAGMLPKLWLEYGRPDEEGALELTDGTRARVAERLGVDPASDVEGWQGGWGA